WTVEPGRRTGLAGPRTRRCIHDPACRRNGTSCVDRRRSSHCGSRGAAAASAVGAPRRGVPPIRQPPQLAVQTWSPGSSRMEHRATIPCANQEHAGTSTRLLGCPCGTSPTPAGLPGRDPDRAPVGWTQQPTSHRWKILNTAVEYAVELNLLISNLILAR